MKPPTLTDLHAAIAVAHHRSFRAAARALALSPSALSHLVGTLEDRLGLRLFHRTTRSVSVTPAGERFLARVTPAVRELAEAFSTARDDTDGQPSGTLRINASHGALARPDEMTRNRSGTSDGQIRDRMAVAACPATAALTFPSTHEQIYDDRRSGTRSFDPNSVIDGS